MEVIVDGKGKARFHGISDAILEHMTPDQLVVELQRVKDGQQKLSTILAGMPRYAQFVGENVKQRNCLAGERRRIERELKRRYDREKVKRNPEEEK